MEQRLTIIGLGVNDLTESEKFYCETLGWTKEPSSNESIVFIKLNGILLSLYPKDKLAEDAQVSPEGSGFSGFTLAHNPRSKEEVDAVFADLRAKGVHIQKEPEAAFWGGYSGYFTDPNGYLWEVAFNPYLPIDDDGNV